MSMTIRGERSGLSSEFSIRMQDLYIRQALILEFIIDLLDRFKEKLFFLLITCEVLTWLSNLGRQKNFSHTRSSP